MINQWVQWKSSLDISPNFRFQSCLDGGDGPFVLLADANHKLKIFFNGRVFAYKKTSLHLKQKPLAMLSKLYADVFAVEWFLFEIINSTFIQSLSDGSFGFYSVQHFRHFVIVTTSGIIEIVSATEPVMEISTKDCDSE